MRLKGETLKRSAAALTDGPAILASLQEPKARQALVIAASKGVPPVSGVSEMLLGKHGDTVKLLPVRQFIGTAVKAILAEEGFEVAETGVRLPRDPVFTTGAVYRRITPINPTKAKLDLLDRIVSTLEPAELHRLIDLANRALRGKPTQ